MKVQSATKVTKLLKLPKVALTKSLSWTDLNSDGQRKKSPVKPPVQARVSKNSIGRSEVGLRCYSQMSHKSSPRPRVTPQVTDNVYSETSILVFIFKHNNTMSQPFAFRIPEILVKACYVQVSWLNHERIKILVNAKRSCGGSPKFKADSWRNPSSFIL